MTAREPHAVTGAEESRVGSFVQPASAALVTYGWFVVANYLAEWRLRPWELAWFGVAWLAVLVVGAIWQYQRWPRPVLAEIAVWIAGLLATNAWLIERSLSVTRAVTVAGVVMLLTAGWRWWLATPARRAGGPAEGWRVLAVLLAAAGVSLPLITPHFVSGADARWYAYMLHDFIEQWRADGPPVFIGQGIYAWNGGVHPFRSAPVYMHLAGVWDWLTGAVLSVCSLQHLTAITAAAVGGLGVYLAGARFAPGRRWESAAVAMLYVMSPSWLMPLMFSDAYMTYVAGAALVLVLYGNARLLLEERGWAALAAGLSLTWMSHPPSAMLAALVTGVLQGGRLAFSPAGLREWLRAAGGAVLFLGFSACYFVGMAELPPTPGIAGLRMDLVQLVGLGLGWLALGQLVVMRRSLGWGAALLAGGGLLYSTNRPWCVWLVVTTILLILAVAVLRRGRRAEPAEYGPLLLLGSVFAAAWLLDAAIRWRVLAVPHYQDAVELWRGMWSGNYFHPLTPSLNTPGDSQPGWGLWLGWPAVALAARRSRAAQLWFAAITLLSVLILPWPGCGPFLVEFIPENVRHTVGLTMGLRTLPLFAGLLAFGALLAWREAPAVRSLWRRRIAAALVILLVGWGASELRPILMRGFRAESSRELTATYWRPDSAHFDRFVYDLVRIPDYFSHGKFYPEMELRLWGLDRTLLYGPADTVRAMEAAGTRRLRLEIPPGDATGKIDLGPAVSLEPGERAVLRFEFDARRHYDGYLFLDSEHSHLEYILPASGWPYAFGTGEGHGRHLLVWNSGPSVENHRFAVYLNPGATKEPPAGFFADVVVSRYDPARAAIQLESLNPWRARTRWATEAWLQTSRVFLPGYEVRRDGQPVPATDFSMTPDGLVQVRVPAGDHVVELRYTGTRALRAAGWISLATWLAYLVHLGLRRRSPAG